MPDREGNEEEDDEEESAVEIPRQDGACREGVMSTLGMHKTDDSPDSHEGDCRLEHENNDDPVNMEEEDAPIKDRDTKLLHRHRAIMDGIGGNEFDTGSGHKKQSSEEEEYDDGPVDFLVPGIRRMAGIEDGHDEDGRDSQPVHVGSGSRLGVEHHGGEIGEGEEVEHEQGEEDHLVVLAFVDFAIECESRADVCGNVDEEYFDELGIHGGGI